MANSNQFHHYVFYLQADINQFTAAMRTANQQFTDVQQTANKGIKITVDKSNVEGLKGVVKDLTATIIEEARATNNLADYTAKYTQATRMQSDFLRQYDQKLERTAASMATLQNSTLRVAKSIETDFLDSIRKISRDGDLAKVTEAWNGALSKTEQEVQAASRVTVQYKDANGQLIETIAVLNNELDDEGNILSSSYIPMMTRVISSKEQEVQATQKQAEALRKESDHVSEVIRKYTELGIATSRTNSSYSGNMFGADIEAIELGRQKALAAQSVLSSGNVSATDLENVKTLVQGLDSDLIQLKEHIAETTREAEEAGAKLPMSFEKADESAVKLDERFNKLASDIEKQKDKYGANVFSGLSGGVEKAKEDLKNLNAVFARTGDVDSYIQGINELKNRFSTLKAEFTRLRTNTAQLPMTMEQARKAVLDLGTGFAKLSVNIENTKDKYEKGTFDGLSESLTNAKTTLENLTTSYQNGKVSEEAYGNAILLLIQQLNTLQAEFEQTKDSGQKKRKTIQELDEDYDKLRGSIGDLQTTIRNAESRGFAAGTFSQTKVTVEELQKELHRLNEEFKNTKDIDAYEQGLKKVERQLKSLQADVKEKSGTAPQSATRDNFLENMGKYARWYFGGNIITSVKRSFTEALSEIKAVDSQLIQVKKVTDASTESLKRMGDAAYEVGKKYGVAASEYLDAVASYSRAGMGDVAEELAELSVKASLVGDMAQDSATAMFLAIQKSYNATNAELSSILDGLNELDNKHATTIENITEGLGKVASIAATAHVGYDELAASIGTITAITQRSGTEAATALRALFLNIIGDTKTEITEGETATIESINNIKDALKKYAPEVVNYAEKTQTIIDPIKAIEALATAYKKQEITEQKLMEILSGVGGKLRTGQLTALVTHWDEYTSQLEHFNKSFGSADKEVSNALDSWEKKTQILSNTWTEFIQKSVETDFIKFIIDRITGLINLLGELKNVLLIVIGVITAIKLKSIISGLTSLITKIKTVITTALAGASALSAFQVAVLGLTAAFAAYVMISNTITESLKKQAEASSTEAQKTKQSVDKLQDLYKAYKQAADGSKEKLEASEKLAEALGKEKGAVEDLTDAYNEQMRVQAAADRAASFKAQGDAGRVLVNSWRKFGNQKYTAINSDILDKLPKEAAKILTDALKKGKIKQQVRGGRGSQRSTEFTAISDRAEDILAYIDVLTQVEDKVAEVASLGKEGFDNSIFDQNWWGSLTAAASHFSDEVNAYRSEYQNWLRAKAVDDFYTAVEHGALKSTAALGRYIQTVRMSTEYSEDMKDMLIQMAMEASGLATAADSIEEVENNLSDAAEEAEKAASAIQRFKDALQVKNTDDLEELIDIFEQAQKAAKEGKYGAVEFQEGMKALLSPEKFEEFANAGNWKGMSDFVEGLFGKEGNITLDNAPIGFFNWLANNHGELEEGSKNVWDIANGVLTITKNAEGDWNYSLKNHGLDASTVEDVQQAIHDLSDEIGISEDVLYGWFEGMSVFNPGQFELFQQAKEQFFEEVTEEFKLSGENIDSDSIISVLAPCIQTAFARAYQGALDEGADGETALSRGFQAAIEYASRHADLSDPEVQSKLTGVLETALAAMGIDLTPQQMEAIGAAINNVVGEYSTWESGANPIEQIVKEALANPEKFIEKDQLRDAIQFPVKEAFESAFEQALGQGASVWEAFESAAAAAFQAAMENGVDFENAEDRNAFKESLYNSAKQHGVTDDEIINKYIPSKFTPNRTVEKALENFLVQAEKKITNKAAEISYKPNNGIEFEGNGLEGEEASLNQLKEKAEHYLGLALDTLVDATNEFIAQNNIDIDDSFITGEELRDEIQEIWDNIDWEDVEKHPEKYKEALEKVATVGQAIVEGTGEIPPEIQEANDKLGVTHALMVFIEEVLKGIKELTGDIELNIDKDGEGEEGIDGIGEAIENIPDEHNTTFNSNSDEAVEGAGAVQQAVEDVPDEKETTYKDNHDAAVSGANAVAAAVNAVPSGKTITFTIKTVGGVPKLAKGTDYFEGGMAMVNDEPGGLNPELIIDQGKAFIANNGEPALVSLSRGAKILNADETKELIKGGSNIDIVPRFVEGNYHLTEKDKGSGGGGGAKKTKEKSSSDKDDKDENKWFDLLKEYMEELYEEAERALDDEKEAITAQILALKYQTEAAEKANELEEKRLEMIQAENDLLDAQHERTVRYFNAETNQWEWMADQKAVLEAQEKLADAQKDYLDAQYDYLEDLWKKIEDEIDDYLEEKNDLDIEEILNELKNSAAESTLGSVNELIQLIKDFTSNPTSGIELKQIASVYDSGGIATGKGFMPKGSLGKEVVLDNVMAGRILSPTTSGEFTAFTQNLASLLDMSSAFANPQSLLNKLSNVTNNNGGNTYINGVQIGSDYMNKPLSEVLSVLGIYANA